MNVKHKQIAIGIGMFGLFALTPLLAEEEFLEPAYLVKVRKTEVENRKVLLGPEKVDAGLREIYLTVTGTFRSLEGRASEARAEDFITANDRFTQVTNVFLRLTRGQFDDLVGRPERDQTIRFKVNGLDNKIAYLPEWPREEVVRAHHMTDISLHVPQPMRYFRFEIDPKDPEHTPVKISEVDTAPKGAEGKPRDGK